MQISIYLYQQLIYRYELRDFLCESGDVIGKRDYIHAYNNYT